VTETTTTIEKVTDENGKESVKVTVVETKTEPTDDVQDGDADFDITQVESTTIEREVTIETTGTVEVTDQSSTDLEAIAPEDYEGKAFDNKEGLLNGITPDALQSYADQVAKPDAEGYIYQWTGYAEATNAVRAVGVDVVYKKDENGNALVDENGDYIIESITYTGKYGDGMDSTPSIFALTKYDEEGNAQSYYYAYCIDHDTEAQPGSWYKITNLEDSDYYPDEESAAKLRAVVTNGYFGTEEGTGSFAQMKEKLEAYYDENAEVTIDDKDGNPVTFKVADVLGRLNEADALAVTQTAIWSYANGTLGLQDGKDGGLIKAIYSVVKPKSNLANCDRDYDYERDAALKAMYEWLLAIEPIEQGSDDVSTVINEKNFVDDMSLTIKDKVEDHEDNKDDKDDNDVYNTELNFTLAFVPDQKTDDLLVYLLDDQGNKIKDADGNDIVKRLAGENSEGREADTITADENGVYTLTGIQLSENSEYKFDLQLEGTQYLKEGVYVYTAHGGVSASQTMVGMASGTQDVNVKASMSIKFEVDESKTVVATRKWRETTEEVTPRETEDNPPPAEYRLGFGVGQLEVIEEEVPLAAPPQTGDMSILWFAMIVMSGCGLCILNLLEKRKCRA